MVLGHSDLVMRQEQYKDLLREAQQARFIHANGLGRSNGGGMVWNLVRMIRSKFGKPQPPTRLKRVVL